jgi:hypothetical protein
MLDDESNPRDWNDYLRRLQGVTDLYSLHEWHTSFVSDVLTAKYGPGVLALANDDEQLVACVESDDRHLQRMAFECLTSLNFVYHETIFSKACEYIEFCGDIDMKVLGLEYLTTICEPSKNVRIITELKRCAAVLRSRSMEDHVQRFMIVLENAISALEEESAAQEQE